MRNKKCARCKQAKPLTDFYRDKQNKDGYKGVCKKCQAAYDKAHHAQNAEKYRARSYEWKEAHPDKQTAHVRKSSVKRYAATGPQKPQELQAFIAETGYCLACGTTENLSVDHVIPLAKGGAPGKENWQVLCIPCNSRKMLDVIDYRPMVST